MAWFGVGVAVWMLIGVAIAIWQRRRGHHLLTWIVLGLVFGPLTLVLAVDAERGLTALATDPLDDPQVGDQHVGPVDVLIGMDGSERSLDAARSALAVLGDRLGRVTLVQALDHETAIDPRLGRESVEARLEADRDALGVPDVRTAVAVGKPDEVLRRLAIDHRYDLVVVGSQGAGMTDRLLGSVARALLSGSPVPVLVGPSSRVGSSPTADPTAGSTLQRPCGSPIESEPTSD